MEVLDSHSTLSCRIYNFLYINRWECLLRGIPILLLNETGFLQNSIGLEISTYVDRYVLSFLRPLYQEKKRILPAVKKLVIVNLFYDENKKEVSHRRIGTNICCRLHEDIIFALHDKPKEFTRPCNETLLRNKTDYTRHLVDGLQVFLWFRPWLELVHWMNSYSRRQERTWSSFLISVKCLENIEWCYEEVQRFTFGDIDYAAKCMPSEHKTVKKTTQYQKDTDQTPVRTLFYKKSSIERGEHFTIVQGYSFKRENIFSHDKFYFEEVSAGVERAECSGRIIRSEELSLFKRICYENGHVGNTRI